MIGLANTLDRGKETLYKGERKTPTGEQPVRTWNGKWDPDRGLCSCWSLKGVVYVHLLKGKSLLAWPYSQQGHKEDRREGNPGSRRKDWTQKRIRKQGSCGLGCICHLFLGVRSCFLWKAWGHLLRRDRSWEGQGKWPLWRGRLMNSEKHCLPKDGFLLTAWIQVPKKQS